MLVDSSEVQGDKEPHVATWHPQNGNAALQLDSVVHGNVRYRGASSRVGGSDVQVASLVASGMNPGQNQYIRFCPGKKAVPFKL